MVHGERLPVLKVQKFKKSKDPFTRVLVSSKLYHLFNFIPVPQKEQACFVFLNKFKSVIHNSSRGLNPGYA